MLGDRERDARRQEAFGDRVVGGVDEQRELAGRGAGLEHVAHHRGVGVRHAHRREHDAECLAPDVGLRRDLGRELEMGKTADGEHRQLLAPHQRGHHVDRRDSGQHRIGRREARRGIEREAGDLAFGSGQHGRTAVDRIAPTVPRPAEPAHH